MISTYFTIELYKNKDELDKELKLVQHFYQDFIETPNINISKTFLDDIFLYLDIENARKYSKTISSI